MLVDRSGNTKSIENINVGDSVVSFVEATGEITKNRVTRVTTYRRLDGYFILTILGLFLLLPTILFMSV